MMISRQQYDQAVNLLSDGDFMYGVGDAADRALDRLVESWSSGNPVVEAALLIELLKKAASRLGAAAVNNDHFDIFIGGAAVEAAPMLRELLEFIDRAAEPGPETQP